MLISPQQQIQSNQLINRNIQIPQISNFSVNHLPINNIQNKFDNHSQIVATAAAVTRTNNFVSQLLSLPGISNSTNGNDN